eukprot:Hpha_TRINITY_DN16814_c5_g9::TRINITY_DN16814_c5_g9_i1::g.151613::m.151613
MYVAELMVPTSVRSTRNTEHPRLILLAFSHPAAASPRHKISAAVTRSKLPTKPPTCRRTRPEPMLSWVGDMRKSGSSPLGQSRRPCTADSRASFSPAWEDIIPAEVEATDKATPVAAVDKAVTLPAVPTGLAISTASSTELRNSFRSRSLLASSERVSFSKCSVRFNRRRRSSTSTRGVCVGAIVNTTSGDVVGSSFGEVDGTTVGLVDVVVGELDGGIGDTDGVKTGCSVGDAGDIVGALDGDFDGAIGDKDGVEDGETGDVVGAADGELVGTADGEIEGAIGDKDGVPAGGTGDVVGTMGDFDGAIGDKDGVIDGGTGDIVGFADGDFDGVIGDEDGVIDGG